ncbi:MAG: tetratricopeptide repeat protein [Thiobacillus sp.]
MAAAPALAGQKVIATPVAMTPALPVTPAHHIAPKAVSAVPVEPARAVVPVREAVPPQPQAEPPGPAAPQALTPIPVVAPIVAQTELAVVKKMSALSPEAEAQQHYNDALALGRAGKIEAAIGTYRQALDRDPEMANARIELARLLQARGQANAALSLLKTGYAQRADADLAIAIGRLQADQGQRDEALAWLARGQTDLRPADHALMGALLSQGQHYEAASQAYQRALAAEPDQGGWLLGLGVALEAQGRIEEARVAYRNALERGQFKPEVTQFLRARSGQAAP